MIQKLCLELSTVHWVKPILVIAENSDYNWASSAKFIPKSNVVSTDWFGTTFTRFAESRWLFLYGSKKVIT